MAGTLQTHPVHHGHRVAGKGNAGRKGQAHTVPAEGLCRFLRILLPALPAAARQGDGRGRPHHTQRAVPQHGGRQGQEHPEPEGGVQMAARTCQVHPFRHLHAALADVPAKAAHQFHGGGRKKRGQRHTPALGHTGGTGVQPATYRRFRRAEKHRRLAGRGVHGTVRSQVPGLRTRPIAPRSP